MKINRPRFLAIALAICFAFRLPANAEETLSVYQATQVQMGVKFTIVLYAADEKLANEGFAAAFGRINDLNSILSDYDPESELSKLGASSPQEKPRPISRDLANVLLAGQKLSEKSEGAFDVTLGPLTKLWRRARRQESLPPADLLAAARAASGYKNLKIDEKEQTAQLLLPNMRLDLGGIAKGYAADQALLALQKLGIERALVNGSGDMAFGEPPPGESGWKVGVVPLGPAAEPSRFLYLANCGIATSGDAFQHVEIGGVRYSHILDPKTGAGLTDQTGVTVIAPDCMTADSLASAVSVLGSEKGFALLKEYPGSAALVVQTSGEKVKTAASENWKSAAGYK